MFVRKKLLCIKYPHIKLRPRIQNNIDPFRIIKQYILRHKHYQSHPNAIMGYSNVFYNPDKLEMWKRSLNVGRYENSNTRIGRIRLEFSLYLWDDVKLDFNIDPSFKLGNNTVCQYYLLFLPRFCQLI